MNRLPPAILFDWDNTLVDTLPLIRDANNAIRRKFDLPLWSLEEAHASTQNVGREGLRANYGERWEEAERLFYDYVQTNHLESLVTLHGAEALVTGLHTAGVSMGIVSNKRGGILRREVAHLGWDRFFGTMLGPDDIGYSGKPKPEGIFAAIDALGIPHDAVANVWYVGDTENDLRTALAAGVVPVYIENPSVSKSEDIAALQPAFSFANCSECLDYLKTLVDSAAQ